MKDERRRTNGRRVLAVAFIALPFVLGRSTVALL